MPELIRDDFPALASGRVYLDNAATTHQPRAVMRAVNRVHRTRARHAGRRGDLCRCAGARGAACRRVGGKRGFLRRRDAGDPARRGRIRGDRARRRNRRVVGRTHRESGAVATAGQHDAAHELRVVDVDANGTCRSIRFAPRCRSGRRFVAITHVSNVLGTTLPVRDIVESRARRPARAC